MSQDPDEQSRLLFDSAANVVRSAQNLDTLFSSLGDILYEAEFGGRNERDADSDTWDGNGWITPVYTGNILVKQLGRGRRPPKGRITYLVRLCGQENYDDSFDGPWQTHACLIVGWHHGDEVWEPHHFEPPEKENIHHMGVGLWGWGDGPDEVENGYFFVLPLFALRSDDDLRNFVAKPLEALFQADDPRTAAPTALSGIPVMGPLSV